MKSTMTLALSLLASVVVGNPMAANPLDGMTIFTMSYVGPITPGGEDVTLNGTAQEIHAQVTKMNPDFNTDDFRDLTSRDLERRNKILPPCCNPPGIGQCSETAYNDNIGYLNTLPGRCFVGGGPKVCARIACTYGGGVFLCNDNTCSMNPSCQYLASYALDIVNDCPSNGALYYLAGQEFDTDDYNVIVSAQNC